VEAHFKQSTENAYATLSDISAIINMTQS